MSATSAGGANGPVRPRVVVPNRVERDHVAMVVEFLAMRVSQPSKSSHLHPE